MFAQTPQPGTPAKNAPLRTAADHWKFFLDETASPLTAIGTVFNASFSQLTNSDPEYGTDRVAYGERVAASAADIAAQNFFGDFVVASMLHEDPRYQRLGPAYSFWHRFKYAVSRAVVIRTTSGESSFNWDNFLGSAASAGFSNFYYPKDSRTGGAMAIHFSTTVVDNGLVNLAPEFWPDFRRKVFHWRKPND